MNTKGKIVLFVTVIILIVAGFYLLYVFARSVDKANEVVTPSPTVATSTPSSTVYENNQFGFSFDLPASWDGFNASSTVWQGLSIGGSKGEKVVATGTEIILRHPDWSSENQRQDIPIMIFTRDEWSDLQNEKFHIGAAPVGPSELGRNAKYVFALPARYNFAFQTGYQEVEQIIQSKPLKATAFLEDSNPKQIKVGQSETVNGLRITLNKVVQDSRCPVDVQCIEAGAINTNVTFQSGTKKETRNMASDEVPISFDSFKISIVDIQPPRVSSKEVKQSEYIITFRVE